MLAHTASASPARELLERAVAKLTAGGVAAPRLDAELLMATACGTSRAKILVELNSPSPEAVARFKDFIARRAAREPLAYITGHREFYALDLIVTPAVLIPRPETETLVEAALAVIARAPGARILDLGTGSGCIALAIASNAPRAQIVATDVSAAALDIARTNAQRLGLSGRIDFVSGDLFAAVDDARFDLIVSNPPYVEDAAALAPEIRDFEPPLALYAGADGLGFYRRIAASIRDHLESGGMLIIEVGAGQAQLVSELCRDSGAVKVDVINDLGGVARVVQARFA
jgi:release factor glutamine methyltransferase